MMFKNAQDLSRELMELALAADGILGQGTIVDRLPCLDLERRELDLSEILICLREITEADIPESKLTDDIKSTAVSLYFTLSNWKPGKDKYMQTLKEIYGINIEKIPENIIYQNKILIKNELNRLGYSSSWPNNLSEWKKYDEVSQIEYCESIRSFNDICRNLTMTSIAPNLLSGEDCEELASQMVSDIIPVSVEANWIAYSSYEGRYKSKIEVNDKGPFYRSSAALLAFHELYPGHAFEASLKEFMCRKGLIDPFYTMHLLNVKRNMMSEGIADFAINIFRDRLSPFDIVGALEDRIFTDIRHNIAIELLCGNLAFDAAVSRLAESALCSADRASRALRFAQSWSLYFPTYATGYYLVEDMIRGPQKDVWKRIYIHSQL